MPWPRSPSPIARLLYPRAQQVIGFHPSKDLLCGSLHRHAMVAAAMKVLYFLPLAYVADVYGFLIFAPYLAIALMAIYVRWRARRYLA
jgi:hypothetical protein